MEINAIGGYNETGRNMTLVRIGKESVILDMGINLDALLISGYKSLETLHFADLAREGVLPEEKPAEDVKAILLSHGHLDHIGAVPKLAHRYNSPIVGTPFTIEFLKLLISGEKRFQIKNPLIKVEPGKRYKVSKNIEAEFFPVSHSIPQATMIILHTPEGNVVYSGDYKFDDFPVLENKVDYKRLKKIGKEGVKALIVDSVRINKEGYSPSESLARKMLFDIGPKLNSKKGIFATTFSSHIARLKSLVDLAEKLGREPVLLGRSLSEYVSVAESMRLVSLNAKIFRPPMVRSFLNKIKKEREKYFIIATGNQGEPDSVMSNIAKGQYKLKFEHNDQVLFSSSVIPSPINIANRYILESKIKLKGGKVFKDLHASGHAFQEDHRRLIELLEPKHVIPWHGESYKLVLYAEFVLGLNRNYILGKNLHILGNGSSISI